MDPVLYDALLEALRLLFLAVIPATGAVLLAGFLASAVQASMAVNEPAVGYGARLSALAAAIYFTWPSISRSAVSLCEMVFK